MNSGQHTNMQLVNGTFMSDPPYLCEPWAGAPIALKVQATVTMPELIGTGFKNQDIIAFRGNHFAFARVAQCGIRRLGTLHGYQHFLVLGIRGKAADEENDPYLEKTLVEVFSGMHLNIMLLFKVDTAQFGQTAQVEVTTRSSSTGEISILHQANYEDYPSLFHGLPTQFFPQVVTCYRSELLIDRQWGWCPYEKTDFHFAGEVHYINSHYNYQGTMGPNYVSTATIVEGTMEPQNGRIRIRARQSGNPGNEFLKEYSGGVMTSQLVYSLIKMVTTSAGAPGPYLFGLTTHPNNETKLYTMEQVREVTLTDTIANTARAVPLRGDQTMTILFFIAGQ